MPDLKPLPPAPPPMTPADYVARQRAVDACQRPLKWQSRLSVTDALCVAKPCPVCQHAVSESAVACPTCGHLTGRGALLHDRLMHAAAVGLFLGYVLIGGTALSLMLFLAAIAKARFG